MPSYKPGFVTLAHTVSMGLGAIIYLVRLAYICGLKRGSQKTELTPLML